MATFRIHEDIENRAPNEFPQKSAMNGALGQKKRAVLGVLDNQQQPLTNAANKLNVMGKAPKSPLGKKPENIFSKAAQQHQITAKLPAPVVPVDQFKAFKVYEDKNDEKENIQQNECNKKKSEATVSTDEFEEKEDDMDVSQGKIQDPSPLLKLQPLVVQKTKSEKDMFFENVEYQADIIRYLREAELRHRPKRFYMKKQPDITYSMRTILVDWLVEVAEEYRLHTETLYLAVSYIDRFLSYMSVVRAKLQLVGTSAMFIASKFEEIYPPDVGEFVYITDDTYSKKQVLRMEQLILKVLSFDLSIPTPLTFITALCIVHKIPEKTMFMAMYICELSMLEAEPYLQYLPSELASAAIAIAQYVYSIEDASCSIPQETCWSSSMEQKTGYTFDHLCSPIKILLKLYESAPVLTQQAIQEKYKNGKYMQVSAYKPPKQVQFPFPPGESPPLRDAACTS